MNDQPAMTERYRVARFDRIEGVPCPCGTSRRAFTEDPDRTASMHVVEIKADSQTHYHKTMTEIYYVLEGSGVMELDGRSVPLEPGVSVMIKPGCRHRAVGRLKIINVAIPAFDETDEWVD